MLILGLETSGLAGSIALSKDGTLVEERFLSTTGRRHAQTLAAEVDDLLKQYHIAPRQIDVIAVSLGPGSFTGLRVGVVFAKTWAYAAACRVIGIETLALLASQAPQDVSNLWVISDAQRGDFFCQHFRRTEEQHWSATGPLGLVAGEEWLRERATTDVVTGPAAAKVAAEATAAQVCREPWSIQPRAATVAMLAADRAAAGQFDDLWALAPIYFRPSAAEEQAARRGRS